MLMLMFILTYPTLKIEKLFYKYNFQEDYLRTGLNYNRGLTGFEKLPVIRFHNNDNAHTIKDLNITEKCRRGHYLGPNNVPANCNQICRSEYDEFAYKYFENKIVIKGTEFLGSYCMPNTIATCNIYLGEIIWAENSYQCVSKYPDLFGGIGANQIIGCNGKIRDNLTGQTYINVVPSTFRIDDIDEFTNGSYRITCDPELTDSLYNKLLPANLGSRFEMIENICASLIQSAPEFIQPDFIKNICTCQNNDYKLYKNMLDNPKMPCTTCISGWQKAKFSLHGSKYAMGILRQCINHNTQQFLFDKLLIPCSVNTMQNNEACEHGVLLATNTYSPITLENIYSTASK